MKKKDLANYLRNRIRSKNLNTYRELRDTDDETIIYSYITDPRTQELVVRREWIEPAILEATSGDHWMDLKYKENREYITKEAESRNAMKRATENGFRFLEGLAKRR